ncbi:MFS transporter [Dermacoccaceae bacterium W4C1]
MSQTNSPAAQPDALEDRKAWIAFAVVLVGAFMALLDTTIVNVALPTIRQTLDASEATLAWIVSGYALAFGLALIPAGRLGDRYGHKWVFFTGLAIFTGASLWCGLAGDATQLIIARVVQGLGGGIFFPGVQAFAQLLFAPMKRGKAFAVLGMVIGVSTALGPIVGGVLIEALGEESGWRWIFAVNIPIGVLALLATARFVPALAPQDSAARRSRVDAVGLVLLALALSALLVPLIEGQDQGWPLWTYLSLVAGVLLMVAFGWCETRVSASGRTPLVPPRLFAHPQFTAGTVLALVYFASFTSIFFCIALLWQSGLGHSALESGIVTIPFALGNIIGAARSDGLAAKLGRTVLLIGTALVTIGLAGVWVILKTVDAGDLTHWWFLPPLLVAGIGNGLFIAPNARFIVATVDRADAGAAGGVIGTVQRIGSAVGIAVVSSLLFARADLEGVGPDVRAALATGRYADAQQASAAVLADHFVPAATSALGLSIAFAVVAFALVWTLPKRVSLH